MKESTENYENQNILDWTAPSFRHTDKPLSWYLVMGAIVLLFVAYGIYTQDYVISITFIVFASVYYWLQREKPKMVEVVISEGGINFGKHFFAYGSIKNFWIQYEPGKIHTLNINFNKNLASSVSIDFPEDMPPQYLREKLSPYITELKDKEESVADSLIRNFGL